MRSSIILSERVRVLLADDNEAMLARAAAVLQPDCMVVGTAKDGLAALTAAGALQPDVIVLDISMPGMTGLEVAARLRQTGSKAALVFLTVHDDGTSWQRPKPLAELVMLSSHALSPTWRWRCWRRRRDALSCLRSGKARHLADLLDRPRRDESPLETETEGRARN